MSLCFTVTCLYLQKACETNAKTQFYTPNHTTFLPRLFQF